MHLVKRHGQGYPSTQEHFNKAAAHHEAIRLANMNPGTPFYVYVPIEVVIKKDATSQYVSTVPCDHDGRVKIGDAINPQQTFVSSGLSLPLRK